MCKLFPVSTAGQRWMESNLECAYNVDGDSSKPSGIGLDLELHDIV